MSIQCTSAPNSRSSKRLPAGAARPSPLYRNAVGDECLYVESGAARVETTFGALEVGVGDYVVVPTSVVYRVVPTGEAPLRVLSIGPEEHVP